MKRKLKIMNHQIDQLKEEISSKEAALVKEHLEHQRVDKEKEALKAELTRMKQSAAESRAHLEALEMEERKLLKIISEADAERLRQKKELDQVMMMMMMTMVTTLADPGMGGPGGRPPWTKNWGFLLFKYLISGPFFV